MKPSEKFKAKTGSERQEALRKRRGELGLKRREFFLTDAEKLKTDKYIKRLRGSK